LATELSRIAPNRLPFGPELTAEGRFSRDPLGERARGAAAITLQRADAKRRPNVATVSPTVAQLSPHDLAGDNSNGRAALLQSMQLVPRQTISP
jgi:hypothetical protein